MRLVCQHDPVFVCIQQLRLKLVVPIRRPDQREDDVIVAISIVGNGSILAEARGNNRDADLTL